MVERYLSDGSGYPEKYIFFGFIHYFFPAPMRRAGGPRFLDA
jgi:hypothetical protein